MNKEEILELIQAGFAPELIELEFNVPIEKIHKYIKQEEKRKEDEEAQRKAAIKTQEEKEKKKAETVKTQKKPTHLNPTSIPKTASTKKIHKNNTLDILRKNYQKLITSSQTTASNSQAPNNYKAPTELESEKVNQAIEKIKNISESISKMQPFERREKRNSLENMLASLKTINSTPKTVEQLSELRLIFQSPALENLAISHDDKINLRLTRARKNLTEELATAVDYLASQTSDLEELIRLSKQLPIQERGIAHFYTGSVRTKLDTRINQLRTAQTMYNMRNNVSPEISAVVRSIADNTFDLQSARAAISQEAQRRVDAAPKNQFALTKERQEKQVEIQIRTILAEQGKTYPITNPGIAMNNLMLLFSEKDKENAFSRVIDNLTSQGKYDEAKELCSKYIVRKNYDDVEPSISRRARQLSKNITLTQIGSMIVEQLQKPSDPEEDKIFMDLLEDRIQREKLSLQQVIIGTTPSGGKKLTLNDIWYTNTRMQK